MNIYAAIHPALTILVAGGTAGFVTLTTLVVTTFVESRDRRRIRYAQTAATLAAWVEFPYRVRRRLDNNPETLEALAATGHDLQEQLALDAAWVQAGNKNIAAAHAAALSAIRGLVGPAVQDAWGSAQIQKPADMNLGEWGPGAAAVVHLKKLNTAIAKHSGLFW